MKKYGVVLADPPWEYRNTGAEGAAAKVYPTMTMTELRDLPVRDMAADDCVLFLWATWPLVPEAVELVRAWGFDYTTGLPWVKLEGNPSMNLWGEWNLKPQYGTGFWVRGCSELLLLARRGDVRPETRDFVGLLSENFGHSRKPDNVYELAERYAGPYVELFARRRREGWDCWGNEVESDIILAV